MTIDFKTKNINPKDKGKDGLEQVLSNVVGRQELQSPIGRDSAIEIIKKQMQERGYIFEESLGQGGEAEAVLFSDENGKKYVGKIHPVPLILVEDDEQSKVAQKEKEVLEALNHPKIPKHYGFIDFPDLGRFMSLRDFVEGPTLDSILKEKKCKVLPQDYVLKLLNQGLDILDYLHDPEKHKDANTPVIHRDIKPANIIMNKDNPENLEGLIDFGFARMKASNSYSVDPKGDFSHAPPEQWRGDPVSASDIYSLGVTAIQCLLEEVPQKFNLLDPNYNKNFKFSKKDKVPKRIAKVLEKMVRPNLKDRYQSVAEVRKDLNKAMKWFEYKDQGFVARAKKEIGKWYDEKTIGKKIRNLSDEELSEEINFYKFRLKEYGKRGFLPGDDIKILNDSKSWKKLRKEKIRRETGSTKLSLEEEIAYVESKIKNYQIIIENEPLDKNRLYGFQDKLGHYTKIHEELILKQKHQREKSSLEEKFDKSGYDLSGVMGKDYEKKKKESFLHAFIDTALIPAIFWGGIIALGYFAGTSKPNLIFKIPDSNQNKQIEYTVPEPLEQDKNAEKFVIPEDESAPDYLKKFVPNYVSENEMREVMEINPSLSSLSVVGSGYGGKFGGAVKLKREAETRYSQDGLTPLEKDIINLQYEKDLSDARRDAIQDMDEMYRKFENFDDVILKQKGFDVEKYRARYPGKNSPSGIQSNYEFISDTNQKPQMLDNYEYFGFPLGEARE